MPNHVDQDLIVTGPKESLAAFREFASDGENLLSADRFIPYPEKFNHNGCKLMELAAALAAYQLETRPPHDVDLNSLEDVLDTLIEEVRLSAFTYALPDMPERVKWFLLPAGTRVLAFGNLAWK